MVKITPVILCGGSGTRLWPLSRRSYPKQFSQIIGEVSLFQQSARRLSGADFDKPIVLTGSDFRFIVTQQLAEIGADPGAILIEPEPKNTGPAVLAAALHASSADPDSLLLIAPSDHHIPQAEAFLRVVEAGLPALSQGRIVTFGVRPSHPETGYGYLALEETPAGDPRPIALSSFVEKPDKARAQEMVSKDTFLWNAGIFLCRAVDLLQAFATHAPELSKHVNAAVEQAQPDLGFLRLAPEPWSALEAISVDYAIMEKAENLSVVPFSGAWSDLGGWSAVWRESGPDARGVVTSGTSTAIDCEDTLLRSDSDNLEVVGIGLKDIIAVAMSDAVLVASRSRAEDVKLAVTALSAKSASQATDFPKDHRPWGWFESLVVGDRFQVKRIHVHPGAVLSLQSHFHRSEHWIVVEGTAKVTVGDEVKLVTENESIFVPLGVKHRMENPGRVPMVLIEVQTGTYVGEDDIVRYEDVYARGQGTKG